MSDDIELQKRREIAFEMYTSGDYTTNEIVRVVKCGKVTLESWFGEFDIDGEPNKKRRIYGKRKCNVCGEEFQQEFTGHILCGADCREIANARGTGYDTVYGV